MFQLHNFAEIHIQNDLKMATVTEKTVMAQETQVVMEVETQVALEVEMQEVTAQGTPATGMITETEVCIHIDESYCIFLKKE